MEIAHWRSRGGKWLAILTRTEGGYRLEEFKSGLGYRSSIGVSFRPNVERQDGAHKEYVLHDDAEALAWAEKDVTTRFDGRMYRGGIDNKSK